MEEHVVLLESFVSFGCLTFSHFLIGRDCCFPICFLGVFSAQGSQRMLLLQAPGDRWFRAARWPREHQGRGSMWTFKTSHLKKTMAISCHIKLIFKSDLLAEIGKVSPRGQDEN